MPIEPGLWGAGDAYERYMGRWSRRVAPRFVEWLAAAPGSAWIDVGCGTGILTGAILEQGEPSRVLGLDSAPGFLEVARARLDDPRATFVQGDAQALPEPDGAVDVAASGLVLSFLKDKPGAVREMARVVRPGGTVALYVWDYAGHMQLMRHFLTRRRTSTSGRGISTTASRRRSAGLACCSACSARRGSPMWR